MRWLVVIFFCLNALAYDFNLMSSHSNMHHLKALDSHINLAKQYNISVEEVMAISYSYNEMKLNKLASLIKSYKSLKLKNINNPTLLPSSFLFSKLLNDRKLSLLEAIKTYKILTGLSIVLNENKVKEFTTAPLYEFEPKNIFINNNVSLKDTVAHAVYYDSVLPIKVSNKKLSNNISFSSESFKNQKQAHNTLMRMLNKKVVLNKHHLIAKAKQSALNESFGVIYLVNSKDEIEGGFIFDTFDGSMKEFILN